MSRKKSKKRSRGARSKPPSADSAQEHLPSGPTKATPEELPGQRFLLPLLVVVTCVVYAQVASHRFIGLDDALYVGANPHVQQGLSLETLRWACTSTHAFNWHPLTWLSHMLDVELFGMDLRGHHLVNLLFHVANTALLFIALRRLSGAVWQSATVAALFALHPFHVESVAWIAERKDVLSTLFWFLAMWLYARYVESPGPSRYLQVLLAFALGLLAKPMLVTLPFTLLLLDHWPLRRLQLGLSQGHSAHPRRAHKGKSVRGDRRSSSLPRLIWEKVPFFALSAIFSVVTVYAQGPGAAYSAEQVPLGPRVANALVSYVRYIAKTIWPQGLAPFYPHPYETPALEAAAAGLILISLSLVMLWPWRRRSYLAVGWLWFLGTLVPVIGLLQVGEQAMADRYTYVPLIGLFVMFSWGVAELAPKWSVLRNLVPPFVGMALAGLSGLTWIQLGYWRTNEQLFERTLEVTSRNAVAHAILGKELLSQGRRQEAIQHLEASLRIDPYRSDALNNLGAARLRRNDLEAAVRLFKEALRIRPGYYQAHYNLATALERQGRPDEAIGHYRIALRLNPYDPDAHFSLGSALHEQGRFAEAIALYVDTLRPTKT
jgi:tetratricopeptide (TPR) repeat protein